MKEAIRNFNFSVPESIAVEFDRIRDTYGAGNKIRWAVCSAALLKLIELPDQQIHDLVGRIISSRHMPAPRGFAAMVEKARATSRAAAKRTRASA